MILDPVIIFATSKSGSSLVTRLFHEHGFWVGNYGEKNGYPTYENRDINRSFIPHVAKGDNGQRVLMKPVDEARALIEQHVPQDTRWVYKAGIDFWNVWNEIYPQHDPVFVKRGVDAVARSWAGTDVGHCYEQGRKMAVDRYAFMDEVNRERWVPVVKSHRLIQGDLVTLEAALKSVGVRMDRAIVDRCIEPGRWHQK